MYKNLDYYSSYSETLSKTFGTKINSNIICIHGYPNSSKIIRRKLGLTKNLGIFLNIHFLKH